MSTSTVPAVLAALVATVRAAVPPSVSVSDGPPLRANNNDIVCIGYSGQLDQGAVTVSQTVASFDLGNPRESYDVSCLISSTRPVNKIAVVRADVFVLFDLIAAALAADQTLGGSDAQATLTTWDYVPGFVEKGTAVDIQFTVHIEAWRKP